MRKVLTLIAIFFIAVINTGCSSEGELHISSDAKGADIYIDGEKKGVVGDGFTVITVNEGEHKVHITKHTQEWIYEGTENTFVANKSSIELYVRTHRTPTQYRINRLAKEKIEREERLAEQKKLRMERLAKERIERELAKEKRLAKERQEKEQRISDAVNAFGSKINNEGKKIPPLSDSWSCVLSKSTNLMWEVKSGQEGLRNHKNTYTWYDPLGKVKGVKDGEWSACNWPKNCNTDAYLKEINSKKLCGYSDWRIPTIAELEILADGVLTVQDNNGRNSIDFVFPYWRSDKCCYISSSYNSRGELERLHTSGMFSRITTSSNSAKYSQGVRVVRDAKERVKNIKEFRKILSGTWHSEEPVKRGKKLFKLGRQENSYLLYSVKFPNSDLLKGAAAVTLYSKLDKSISASVEAYYEIDAIGRLTLKEKKGEKLWRWRSGDEWDMLYNFNNHKIKARYNSFNFTLVKK